MSFNNVPLRKSFVLFFLAGILFFSCSRAERQPFEIPAFEAASNEELLSAELPDLAEAIARFSREIAVAEQDREAFVTDFWRWIFAEAGVPDLFARRVAASALESPAFIMELLEVLQQDPLTFFLVDKQHALPSGFEPDDLVPITPGLLRVTRDGMLLRRNALDALYEMAIAAAADGITFTIGSAYRSYAHQTTTHAHWVRVLGREEAERVSARPGPSQHQLGMVVDFAPISDAFAETPASQWLVQNASRFGWSLSYPYNYEEVTGYRWESWHYRYVGRALAAFIDTYFGGIQQYALQFIQTWQKQIGD